MVLSSRIGIYGGLLGAAVGAGVAAIANQLFRSLISVSADKLKELSPYGNDSEPAPTNAATTAQNNPYEMLGNTARAQKQGARIAPDYYRQLQKDQQIHYRMIAAGIIVAALGAMGITAWLVDTLSAGQGFGTKVNVPVITQPKTTKQTAPQQVEQTEQQQTPTQEEKSQKHDEHSSEPHKPSTDEKSSAQQEQQNATPSPETPSSSENTPSNNNTGDGTTPKKPSERSNNTNTSTNNSQNNSNNSGDTKTNTTTP